MYRPGLCSPAHPRRSESRRTERPRCLSCASAGTSVPGSTNRASLSGTFCGGIGRNGPAPGNRGRNVASTSGTRGLLSWGGSALRKSGKIALAVSRDTAAVPGIEHVDHEMTERIVHRVDNCPRDRLPMFHRRARTGERPASAPLPGIRRSHRRHQNRNPAARTRAPRSRRPGASRGAARCRRAAGFQVQWGGALLRAAWRCVGCRRGQLGRRRYVDRHQKRRIDRARAHGHVKRNAAVDGLTATVERYVSLGGHRGALARPVRERGRWRRWRGCAGRYGQGNHAAGKQLQIGGLRAVGCDRILEELRPTELQPRGELGEIACRIDRRLEATAEAKSCAATCIG